MRGRRISRLAAAAQSTGYSRSTPTKSLTEELDSGNSGVEERWVRFDAYSFPRLAQYLGRWIRHSGWYPDRKVRLYDRRKAEWVGDYVHESVRVKGTTGKLDGDLLHFTCDSLSEHLRTLDRYTSLAAQEMRGAEKGCAHRGV